MRKFLLVVTGLVCLPGLAQVEQINTGTTTHLLDLSKIGNNIIISGRHDYIRRSYDECNTLDTIQNPSDVNYLNRIARKDTDIVYLLSYSTNQTLFYRSDDGGKNWEQRLDTFGSYARFIDFFDNSEGLLADNFQVMRTKDGGITWSTAYYYGLVGVTALKTFGDSMVCVGLGDSNCFLSKDRGHTWPYAFGVAAIANDFFFLNKDTIFCTGGLKLDHDFIFTTDGGIIWTHRDLPMYSPMGINFKNANEGYVVGATIYTMGTVLKTTDMGKTWTIFDTGIKTQLFGMTILNDSIALLNGSHGVLLRWNYKNTLFTDINEFDYAARNVKVFPNPVRDKVNIEFEEVRSGKICATICNALGQTVFAKKQIGSSEVVDLGSVGSGVYYLILSREEGGQRVYKVVKE